MLTKFRALIRNESGATAIEYALLVAGIAVALIGTFSSTTTAIKAVFTSVAAGL